TGGSDVLLDEWQELDPAAVPVPRLDRFIHFHRSPDQLALLQGLFRNPEKRPDLPLPSAVAALHTRQRELKRRYAFEGKPKSLFRSLEAPGLEELFASRHFEGFRAAIQGDATDERLAWLLSAISRADGVPARASQSGLALRITENATPELVVVKRFAPSQF